MVTSQVETIGDAYMVVGGLPKPCDNHAEKVAHMACSMMEASVKVLSPVDKTPLKVNLLNNYKTHALGQIKQFLLDCRK